MKTAANTQFCGSQKKWPPIATKQDGWFYKNTSLKSTRAAIDRFLCSSSRSTQFSITSHAAFTETNKVLDAFLKDLRKSGKIADFVQKKSISKQQIQKLFYCGEPGLADTKNPAQLQRTTWFYLGLFSGRRRQEKQREMKSGMLTLFGIFNFWPKLTILHGP